MSVSVCVTIIIKEDEVFNLRRSEELEVGERAVAEA